MGPFRVGAVGAAIDYLVLGDDGKPLDISTASVKQLLFRTPPGEELPAVAASFKTDGTDGLLRYLTPNEAFFSAARVGLWEVESYIEMQGFRGAGDPAGFTVAPRLAG